MLNCYIISFLTLIISNTCLLVFSELHPVVLVPGLGGSQLEAKLNKTKAIHWYCYLKSEWYLLWLSIEQLAIADCFVDNMKLTYDQELHVTLNQEGVETRTPGFGNTSTVEWLDPFHHLEPDTFSYFFHIVDRLVRDLNYTRDVSIRGAPFDFRKAPNEMGGFIANLTSLIEETYNMNGKRRVVLLGHSMGNNYIQYLLNHQTRKWKNKYIETYISLSAPWAGSVKPLRLMASGDSLGQSTHVIQPLQARPLERSLPSTAWLMPYDTYWRADETLVYAPHANYTVNDYKDFFDAVEFPDGYLMRKDTENLTKDLTALEVEVHCLFGVGVDTPASLDYRGNTLTTGDRWFDYLPKVITGDGDGTVNLRSLQACQKWQKEQSAPVHVQNFTNAEHLEILRDQRIFDYIEKVLRNLSQKDSVLRFLRRSP